MDKAVQNLVVLPQLLDLLHGMQNSSVVLAAKVAADFRQRCVCKLLYEIHSDLAWIGDLLGITFCLQLCRRHIEALSYRTQNGFDRDSAFGSGAQVFESLLRHGERDGLLGQ